MVLREIGEHGGAYAGALQSMLGQSDGRCLHRTGLHSAVCQIAQASLPQHGIRCGQTCFQSNDRNTPVRILLDFTQAQGARNGTPLPQASERLRQPPGCGGLAIGARHRQHVQCMAGVLVVGRCDRSTRGFELGISRQRCVRRSGPEGLGSSPRPLFHQTRRCATRQHVRHETSPIVLSPGPGQKGVARVHLPAVGAQMTLHPLAQPASSFLGRVESLHQNDSGSALATICGLTERSG